MPNFQKTIIMGHLGRDPELSFVGENRRPVCKFSVAVNNPFKKDEPTNWYNCEVWGKRGEMAAEMLSKGQAVLVDGSLWVREYGKKDGTKGYSLDLRADSWTFASSKGDKATASGGQDHTPF